MELVLPEKSDRKQHLKIALLFQGIKCYYSSSLFVCLELLLIEKRNDKWHWERQKEDRLATLVQTGPLALPFTLNVFSL